MGAEKIMWAKEAVSITKNADKFTSFCNDVIGDISGISSGIVLTIRYYRNNQYNRYSRKICFQIIISMFLTSVIVVLTVGGEAIEKYIAINSSIEIIIIAGKFKIKVF